MPRTIIHLDLDAFFCAIEERRNPDLRGKAFAVGGQPDQRGVVASCSYAARRFGVRSAMSMAKALTLCPRLIVVSTNHADYRAASRQVMQRVRALTPLVEQISIDEAFLDVTALIEPGNEAASGKRLALRLQRQIQDELHLSCSLGVASNKLIAKVATDQAKVRSRRDHTPQALLVVPPGTEADFLAPLPVSALWGVGPKTGEHLARLGMTTIGDIAARPQEEMIRRFGRHGYDLSRHAQGIDTRPVVTMRVAKSISSENTFIRDIEDRTELVSTIVEQADDISRRLKKKRRRGTTIKLKLRLSDFTTLTRQITLSSPTDLASLIAAKATALLDELWHEREPIRLIGVGVSGLSTLQQLELWSTEGEPTQGIDIGSGSTRLPDKTASDAEARRERQRKIEEAIVLLQQRYGQRIVHLGVEDDD